MAAAHVHRCAGFHARLWTDHRLMPSIFNPAKSLATAALDRMALAWLQTAGRRPTDAFLCSYPKSGRTWLRFMLSAYQIRFFRVDFSLTMANFASISPNLTLGARMGLRMRLPHPDMVRVFGTHLPYSRLLRAARIIYLERDLRDVLVSFYHHQRARAQVKNGLDEYVRSPQGLAPAIRYLRGWHRGIAAIPPERLCRLSYEELLRDPAAGLRRTLSFLGLPVDEAILKLAVQDAAADTLRELESATGNYDFSPEQLRANPSAHHIRKARAGTYLDELSPETAAAIAEACRSLRPPSPR